MNEKNFLIFKHGHSFILLLLFLINLFVRRLFLMYVRFMGLAGADSEMSFDQFAVNWKLVNHSVLFLNIFAAAGILSSFWFKDAYPKFWPFFAFVFLINILYPSGVAMVYMTGFHFILFSIMLINSYGFFALVFLRKKWGLIDPIDSSRGVKTDE